MPWKERSIVEERMRFVMCREFGISRVTGYKIYERYKERGLEGLTDRARTPYRYANKLPAQLEAMIVTLRRGKTTPGGPQHQERLVRQIPHERRAPRLRANHLPTYRPRHAKR